MQSSLETLNVVEEKKQAEVGKDERVIPEEMNGKELSPGRGPGEMRKVEPGLQKDSTSLSSESSGGSESEEEEDVGEYRPHQRVPASTIREEEDAEEAEEAPGQAAKVVDRERPVPAASPGPRAGAGLGPAETGAQEKVVAPQLPAERSADPGAVEQDASEEAEAEPQKVNGEAALVDTDVLPEIICCSEVNGSSTLEPLFRWRTPASPPLLSSPFSFSFSDKMLNLISPGRKGDGPALSIFPPSGVTVSGIFTTTGSPERVNFRQQPLHFFFSLLISH